MKEQIRLRQNKKDGFYYVDLGTSPFMTVGEIFYDMNSYRFVPYQKIYFAANALELIADELRKLNKN